MGHLPRNFLDLLDFLHVILLGDLLGLLDSPSLQSDPFSKPSAVNPRSCQNAHPYLLRTLLFQPKMEKFGRMQQDVEKEVGELKKLESELAKSLEGKRSYMESLHENEMALKEFQLLEDDANVFKMIGPVLVKQDTKEAQENVKRRLNYYKEEIERKDKYEEDLQSKIQKKTEGLVKRQQEMQQLYTKMNAMAAK